MSRPVRTSPTALQKQARQLETQLNLIQRHVRQTLQAEFARGQLTGPQRLVMQAVVESGKGLSLKQLSHSVSLAHSTVSGIVDRLERAGMLARATDPTDGRITRLIPSRAVREFLSVRMPELTVHPLVEALSRATRAERDSIETGVDTLARLLASAKPNSAD
jgi:DNA-binding MarR family transcriptional regulator